MKKIISLLLCLVVLVGAFCLAISGAGELPKPVGTTELKMCTELPTDDPAIVDLTRGLKAPAPYSPYTYQAETLTAYDQWELGRYITYGISITGIHALKRPLSTAIDDVWTVGNARYEESKPLTNGQHAYGALEFMVGDERYNLKGETGKADSIYQCYMTFNFGQIAAIDSFGFICTDSYGGQFSTFDVFVSNDGENWTNVGYADQIARKVAGDEDYSRIDAKLLGEDITGKIFTKSEDVEETKRNGATGRLYLYDLNGVEGQFLRVAATVSQRKGGNDPQLDALDYNTYCKEYKEFASTTWREMVVYGTKLDKENTVTATEAPAPQTSASSQIGNLNGMIPAKNTTAADTTAAPETTAATTVEEETKGCGSTVGVSMIAMAITAVGATTVVVGKKKRR